MLRSYVGRGTKAVELLAGGDGWVLLVASVSCHWLSVTGHVPEPEPEEKGGTLFAAVADTLQVGGGRWRYGHFLAGMCRGAQAGILELVCMLATTYLPASCQWW